MTQRTTEWVRRHRQMIDRLTEMLWECEEWNISLADALEAANVNFRDEDREKRTASGE